MTHRVNPVRENTPQASIHWTRQHLAGHPPGRHSHSNFGKIHSHSNHWEPPSHQLLHHVHANLLRHNICQCVWPLRSPHYSSCAWWWCICGDMMDVSHDAETHIQQETYCHMTSSPSHLPYQWTHGSHTTLCGCTCHSCSQWSLGWSWVWACS